MCNKTEVFQLCTQRLSSETRRDYFPVFLETGYHFKMELWRCGIPVSGKKRTKKDIKGPLQESVAIFNILLSEVVAVRRTVRAFYGNETYWSNRCSQIQAQVPQREQGFPSRSYIYCHLEEASGHWLLHLSAACEKIEICTLNGVVCQTNL